VRTQGATRPGDVDPPRPGQHTLPAADFMIQVVVWIVLLLAGLVGAYVMVGALHRAGLVAAAGDSVWALRVWVVPAAGVMALLRTLGLARLVDWLGLLPLILPVGVLIIALVPLAIVTTIVLLLRRLGVDTAAHEPALVLASHAFGALAAVGIWLSAWPFGRHGVPAKEPREHGAAAHPSD
jgi:hypothetical protein